MIWHWPRNRCTVSRSCCHVWVKIDEIAIGSCWGLPRASTSPRTSECAQTNATGTASAHNAIVWIVRKWVFGPDTGALDLLERKENRIDETVRFSAVRRVEFEWKRDGIRRS